jgi:hypothetical protein
VRVHGSELSDQALHEAEKLSDDAVALGLKNLVERALGLSSEIGAAIDDLRVSPGNRSAAVADARAENLGEAGVRAGGNLIGLMARLGHECFHAISRPPRGGYRAGAPIVSSE